MSKIMKKIKNCCKLISIIALSCLVVVLTMTLFCINFVSDASRELYQMNTEEFSARADNTRTYRVTKQVNYIEPDYIPKQDPDRGYLNNEEDLDDEGWYEDDK